MRSIDLPRGLSWALAARGLTARALRTLLASEEDPERILALSPEEAADRARTSVAVVAPLLTVGSAAEIARQEKLLHETGTRLVTLLDAEYPALLRQIDDPPFALFVRGALPAGLPIAVVGARRASRHALEATRLLCGDLARRGVVVVSGFARGVDAAAHRASLDAPGATIAVLGCGVDVCYPPEQRKMFDELARKGALVSELPMGTPPRPFHFPIRNRIIAGLSRLVLVVEAAEKSGSLITARYATDYGRDVAAVPGPIVGPAAKGSNALLKDGAIFVTSAEDLLRELPEALTRDLLAAPGGQLELPLGTGQPHGLPQDAARLLDALDPYDPRDADGLVAATGLTAARLSAALVVLELEGLVTALPGAVFVRSRRVGA